jgi:hypothetical protein
LNDPSYFRLIYVAGLHNPKGITDMKLLFPVYVIQKALLKFVFVIELGKMTPIYKFKMSIVYSWHICARDRVGISLSLHLTLVCISKGHLLISVNMF